MRRLGDEVGGIIACCGVLMYLTLCMMGFDIKLVVFEGWFIVFDCLHREFDPLLYGLTDCLSDFDKKLFVFHRLIVGLMATCVGL